MRETNRTMAWKRGLIMEIPTCQSKVKKEDVSVSILIHHLVVGNTLGEAVVERMNFSSRLT